MSNPNAAPVQSSAPVAAYPVLFEGLLAAVSFSLTDDERAYFFGRIDEATARNDGAGVESATVLDACLEAVQISMPLILEGKVSGYGPVRLRHLLEMGASLAGEVAVFDGTVVQAAGGRGGQGDLPARVAR